LDITALNRSGKLVDKEGLATRKVETSSAGVFVGTGALSVDSSPFLPFTELDRDIDVRLDIENKAERRLEEGRDSSALTLELLLELPRGCFFVRRRVSLFSELWFPANCVCSSFKSRFSSSILSASRRRVTRLSFFCETLLVPF
jgi:hypothetical protein